MAFIESKLDLPLVAPPPPPLECWAFFCIPFLIFGTAMIFFLLTLYPTPPTIDLLSADLHLDSLREANFSGTWAIALKISLPSNLTTHDDNISVSNLTATIFSHIDHVLLAQILLPALSLTGEAGTSAIEATLSSSAPVLNDGVFTGWLEDRARGFLVFDLHIAMDIKFKAVPMAMGNKDFKDYKVKFEELKFEFAREGEREGGVTVFPKGKCTNLVTLVLSTLARFNQMNIMS